MARKTTTKKKTAPKAAAKPATKSAAPKPAEDKVITKPTEKPVVPAPKPESAKANDAGPKPDTKANAPTKEDAPKERNGFLPLALGGAMAAALGFGTAHVITPGGLPIISGTQQHATADLTGQITSNQQAIATLQAAEPAQPDLSGLETTQAQLSDRLDGLEQTLAELRTSLDALAARPAGTSEPVEIPDYSADLAALQSALAAQKSQLAGLTSDIEAREAAAAAEEARIAQKAALVAVKAAAETGAGFAAPLATLQASGASISPDISAVATDGIATLDSLRTEFPDLARAALSATRDGGSETVDSLTGFLRKQLGARSLTPQEGNSPDAVLSRAEAAMQNSDLTTTLAELSALPPEGQAPLAAWIETAQKRLNAMTALQALADDLNE